MDLAAWLVLFDTVIGALFVLRVAPRIAERRIVPQVVATFEARILPRLQAEVFDRADQRVAQAKAELEAQAAAMADAHAKFEADVMGRAEARVLAAQKETESRIQAAQKELNERAAAMSATSLEGASVTMSGAAAEARAQKAQMEEVIEAHIVKALGPIWGPLAIGTGKRVLGRNWKSLVKAGPEGVPAFVDQVRPLLPRVANGHENQVQPSWASG